jgi:cell division protein FtsN
MTGYFTSYNPAAAELARLRTNGYADAFVVAYYDGKRVPVYEARNIERGGPAATTTAANAGAASGNFAMTDVEGLVYSVQVGVYAKTRNSTSLFGISPLIEERMTNGYYRYYAGTFNNMNDAVGARNRIRTNGVPDAFVVILYKGKKITQAEAAQLQAGGTTFGGGLKQSGATTQTPQNRTTPDNATPGAKPVYKVQIGAYSKDVPVNVVNELIALAGQGIETTKNDAGLTVYTVGNFSKYSDAEARKTELNAKGLTDAFVVAYVNGKRVSIGEARRAE